MWIVCIFLDIFELLLLNFFSFFYLNFFLKLFEKLLGVIMEIGLCNLIMFKELREKN